MKKHWLVGAMGLGALLLVLLAEFGVKATEDGRGGFSFPSDPALELVRLSFTGGTMQGRTEYSLFADGRLLVAKYETEAGEKTTVLARKESSVNHRRINEVLQHLVDCGFADLGDARRRQLEELRPAYFSSDAGTTWLDLRLPSYRGPTAISDRSVETSFSLRGGLEGWVSSHPAVPEFRCLQDLVPMLRKLEGES
ncbi:MAG: hypothetical protein AAF481_11230 [Acidobacteriota bacterium]